MYTIISYKYNLDTITLWYIILS